MSMPLGRWPMFNAESRSWEQRALRILQTSSDLLSPAIAHHGMISSDAIQSPSSPNKNRRFTGLPGKLPVSRLVTTNFPSFCSNAKGSLVYSYFVEVSSFHFLIAARLRCQLCLH
jgi:hypothetical protein